MLPYRIISTIALAGGITLVTGLNGLDPAIASPSSLLITQAPQERSRDPNTNCSVRPPQSVIDAVHRNVSRRTGVPVGKVRITEVTRATYPNSCLGLPRPGEICAQIIVEGFRVVAFPDISGTARVRAFVYRSDSTGRNLRLENDSTTTPSNLPAAVAKAVTKAASQRTGQATSTFKIVQAEKRTWPDGCLGLSQPSIACTQALVEGWLVTVNGAKGTQLVYRTNESGSLVKLDEAASSTIGNDASTIKPVQIPANQLPPALKQGEVFRVISSGGIAGRTTATTLLADGRVIQSPTTLNGTVTSKTLIGRVSRQQVRQFQQLLDRQQFIQFNRLSYPAPSGAADFFTITLTSKEATVRYTDLIQDRLPRNLQRVIQAFDRLTNKAQTRKPDQKNLSDELSRHL